MSEESKNTLKALKKKYIENLPDKISEIHNAWERCVESREAEDVELVYRAVHSMSGSGATFGQFMLSKAAKALELYIKEKNEKYELFDVSTLQYINCHIDELLSYVDKEQVEESSLLADELPSGRGNVSDLEFCQIRPLEIMVVDDDDCSRQQLTLVLNKIGHRVIEAKDGITAIEYYKKYKPELILMDVVMPDINGDEAMCRIKALAGNSFIPIIFITSLNDIEKLAGMVARGGDDFLIKPIEPAILAAKINAFSRISEMYAKLDAYQRETEDELETSKHLLNTLLNIDKNSIPGWSCWAQSPGHFSGDLRLATKRENGEILLLLCDFTGHGLPAAIGTIFVADLFRSMTRKSFTADFILNQINEKMKQILPTGRYCAAIMVSFFPETKTVNVWNCGLPTVFLLDNDNQIVERVESDHVPLGVVSGPLDYQGLFFDTNKLKHIVLYSDGVTEAENRNQEMYSEDRLITAIQSATKEKPLLEQVRSEIDTFIAGMPLTDDLSLIVFTIE